YRSSDVAGPPQAEVAASLNDGANSPYVALRHGASVGLAIEAHDVVAIRLQRLDRMVNDVVHCLPQLSTGIVEHTTNAPGDDRSRDLRYHRCQKHADLSSIAEAQQVRWPDRQMLEHCAKRPRVILKVGGGVGTRLRLRAAGTREISRNDPVAC